MKIPVLSYIYIKLKQRRLKKQLKETTVYSDDEVLWILPDDKKLMPKNMPNGNGNTVRVNGIRAKLRLKGSNFIDHAIAGSKIGQFLAWLKENRNTLITIAVIGTIFGVSTKIVLNKTKGDEDSS